MLLSQMPAEVPDDLGIVFGAPHQVLDLLLWLLIGQDQLNSPLTVDLLDVRRIQPKQWYRVRRRCLKRTTCYQLQMAEQRSVDHRAEETFTHPADDLVEWNWLDEFYA